MFVRQTLVLGAAKTILARSGIILQSRIMRANRKYVINFRLTEIERIELEKRINTVGYKSLSKYIRTILFENRIEIIERREDLNCVKKREELRAEIKKIGVNYNQFVKKVNSIPSQNISSKQMAYFANELNKNTLKIIELFKKYDAK